MKNYRENQEKGLQKLISLKPPFCDIYFARLDIFTCFYTKLISTLVYGKQRINDSFSYGSFKREAEFFLYTLYWSFSANNSLGFDINYQSFHRLLSELERNWPFVLKNAYFMKMSGPPMFCNNKKRGNKSFLDVRDSQKIFWCVGLRNSRASYDSCMEKLIVTNGEINFAWIYNQSKKKGSALHFYTNL